MDESGVLLLPLEHSSGSDLLAAGYQMFALVVGWVENKASATDLVSMSNAACLL